MNEKTKDAVIVGGMFFLGLSAMAFAMILTGPGDGTTHSIWSLRTPFDVFLVGCVVAVVVALVMFVVVTVMRPKKAA